MLHVKKDSTKPFCFSSKVIYHNINQAAIAVHKSVVVIVHS